MTSTNSQPTFADGHSPSSVPDSLADLLALHDARFVLAAYLSILGRTADPGGYANYLQKVRSGAPKMDIVRQLAVSEEGRKAQSTLRGLGPHLRASPGWIPSTARQVASRFAQHLLWPSRGRLRAMENSLGAFQDDVLDRLAHLQWSVARMESRLALSLERLNVPSQADGKPADPTIPTDAVAVADQAAGPPIGGLLGPLIVEFEYSRTASPASVGKSDDTRELALGFVEVAVFDARSGASLFTVNLRTGGNAANSVLFGFSQPEPWGTWSLGGKSALALWLKALPVAAIRLSITANVFHEGFNSVDLTVRTSLGQTGVTTFLRGEPYAQIVLDAPTRDSAPMAFGSLRTEPDPLNVSNSAQEIPVVSIIVLNYNKPVLSMLASLATVACDLKVPYEVLIVDNGSADDLWDMLVRINSVARLVRIPVNRFFGEGNNIGAEGARGRLLVLFNNDAFPTKGCLTEMLAAFEANPECGAACPVFVYPDGRMQEAGAFVRPDGTALQRGKNDAQFDINRLPRFDVVDYGSAACLMVTADIFRRIGGFNYRYDPAYYEDTDLCLRLKLIGLSTVLARDARCCHIENATTSDKQHNAGANRVIELNREVFLSVWERYLRARTPSNLPTDILPRLPAAPDLPQTSPATLSAALPPVTQATFSPYPLTPGGGERYLLSTAIALSRFGETRFTTPDAYSQFRLNNVLTDLGLPTGRMRIADWKSVSHDRLQRLVVMGNEVFPRQPPHAEAAFFHCQFPFPWSESSHMDVGNGISALRGYRKVLVNSEFTRKAYLDALARFGQTADVEVVYPPVGTQHLLTDAAPRKPQIISIGRFTDRGHNKRQDVLIAALKAASPAFRREWKLILCGPVPNEPGAKSYFSKLRSSVGGDMQVDFVLSPSRQTLDRLLLESAVYAHATGFGIDSPQDYWKCEHFGITIVEAVAAGCATYAYGLGGGQEIIRHTGGGETFSSLDQLVALFERSNTAGLGHAARQRANDLFGDQAFADRMTAALAVND